MYSKVTTVILLVQNLIIVQNLTVIHTIWMSVIILLLITEQMSLAMKSMECLHQWVWARLCRHSCWGSAVTREGLRRSGTDGNKLEEKRIKQSQLLHPISIKDWKGKPPFGIPCIWSPLSEVPLQMGHFCIAWAHLSPIMCCALSTPSKSGIVKYCDVMDLS